MSDQIKIDFTDRKAPLLSAELQVWLMIEQRRGKEEAILGARVADLAQVDYDTVRAIISHLVNFHGYLIASCSRGYYVPVTPEEIAAATRSLRHRGIMILRRAARLQNSSLEEVFGQGKMEFEEAGVRRNEMIKNRYIGSFELTLDFINNRPSDAQKIMDGMIILKADYDPASDAIRYTAISPRYFSPIAHGEHAYYYDFIISPDGVKARRQ